MNLDVPGNEICWSHLQRPLILPIYEVMLAIEFDSVDGRTDEQMARAQSGDICLCK